MRKLVRFGVTVVVLCCVGSMVACKTSATGGGTGKPYASESIVKKTEDGEGKALVVDPKTDVMQLQLDYSPTSVPAGQASLPVCVPTFPDTYELGKASCQSPLSDEEVAILAVHVAQYCAVTPGSNAAEGRMPRALPLKNCNLIKAVFYNFEPNLEFSIGRQ